MVSTAMLSDSSVECPFYFAESGGLEVLMSFDKFALSDYLFKAVSHLGFKTPTAIQSQAIPWVLAGRDVVGIAQTGTGKTAAFVLPILEKLSKQRADGSVRTLVVVPTRELAQQVADAFRHLGLFTPRKISVLTVIGGTDIGVQIDALHKGAEVVVATAGRLLDLIDRDELQLGHVQTLVLDEADKLLDLGFAQDLDTLLNLLPARRQNLLFSATFPAKVLALSERFVADPVHLSVHGKTTVADKIAQTVVQVDRDRRRMLLQHLLESENWDQVLVFVATQVAARNLASKLRKSGISASEFHGGLEQALRDEALRRFKGGRSRVLVATDVAARGLDIDQLSCVVNYDLPRSPRDYVHRIGRTARAGQAGVAISFVDHHTEAHFRLIEKQAGLALGREQIDGFALTGDVPVKKKGAAGVKGKRKSKKDKLREQAARANNGE